jgi:hypothetical protein
VGIFEFHQTLFKQLTSAGFNSIRKKGYQISVKILFYLLSISQKVTGVDNLGARNDLTIRISNFFDEMRLSRSLRSLRLLVLPGKSLLMTAESSRFLNLALF